MLARQRELDPSFPLHVRIGIHTGEVLHVDGDLFGRHVNLAARVAGAARADEVLVSSWVYDLVVAIGDIGFGAPRDVELKGFAERVVVRPVADRPPA